MFAAQVSAFSCRPLVAGTQSVHADIVVGAPFIIAGAGVPARSK